MIKKILNKSFKDYKIVKEYNICYYYNNYFDRIMIENIKTYNILISGRVQGVGFRYFAVSVAEKYDVKGYVKNIPGAKVEIVCQGEEEELKSFMEEVKKGPAFSVVADTSVKEVPEYDKYNSFEIKY